MRTGETHVAIINTFDTYRLDSDKIKDLLGDELSDYQKKSSTTKITLQEIDSSTDENPDFTEHSENEDQEEIF